MITGGSAGIGYALADHLSSLGSDVIATGRRTDCTGAFSYCALNMMSDCLTTAADAILDQLEWDTFDVLVLNAGIGHVGTMQDTPDKITEQMMRVNVTAPLQLAHHLRARVTGRIVFIGSVAHRGRHPDFAIYAATKAALRGAVRSWQAESDGTGPFVQMIHPGPSQTEMHDRAGLPKTAMQKIFTPAPVVARSIAKAMQTNRAEVSFGFGYTLRHAARNLIP